MRIQLRAMAGGLCLLAAACATAPGGVRGTAAQTARGLDCAFLTEAEAAASAGVPNVTHDGVRLVPQPPPSTDPNDAIAQRANIPRSAQPPLTASQKRILMCGYELDAANARMPFSLFVPDNYDPAKAWPLIVDLHGAGVTPLQQMLFDGTTDFAQRDGYIVLTPMGFSTFGGWGPARGTPQIVDTSDVNPETGAKWTTNALSEHDALTVLAMVRDAFNVDKDRIYLMGHSMGGFGTFFLGAKHNTLWAGIAPIASRRRGPECAGGEAEGAACAGDARIGGQCGEQGQLARGGAGAAEERANGTSIWSFRARTTSSSSGAAGRTSRRCSTSSTWSRGGRMWGRSPIGAVMRC